MDKDNALPLRSYLKINVKQWMSCGQKMESEDSDV